MSEWVILQTKSGDAHRHSCTKCKNVTMFLGDQPLKAWCCGKWVTPPKENFWGNSPVKRMQHKEPRQPLRRQYVAEDELRLFNDLPKLY
jgi:hypothetical protein